MRRATVSSSALEGDSYPSAPCSTVFLSAESTAGGARKSMSATHIGITSPGYHVHLLSSLGSRLSGARSNALAMLSPVRLYATGPPGEGLRVAGSQSFGICLTMY